MPAAPGPPVRAKTTQASARPANVHDAFSPDRMRSPPSRRARRHELGGVGADPRLGEGEGHHRLAGRHAGQPLLLDVVGAERQEPGGDSGQLEERRHVEVGPADLLGRHAERDVAAPDPAEPPNSGGISMPSTPRSPSSTTRSRGNGSDLPAGVVRRQPLSGVAPDGVPQQLVFFTPAEVHDLQLGTPFDSRRAGSRVTGRRHTESVTRDWGENSCALSCVSFCGVLCHNGPSSGRGIGGNRHWRIAPSIR